MKSLCIIQIACEYFSPDTSPSYKVYFEKQSASLNLSNETTLHCLLNDIVAVNGYKKLGDPSTGRINLDGGGGSSSSGVKTLYNQTEESCQAECECSAYCIGITMEYNQTDSYNWTGKCYLENWLKDTPGQSQYYTVYDFGGVFYYRVDGQVSENPCQPTSAPIMPTEKQTNSPTSTTSTRAQTGFSTFTTSPKAQTNSSISITSPSEQTNPPTATPLQMVSISSSKHLRINDVVVIIMISLYFVTF